MPNPNATWSSLGRVTLKADEWTLLPETALGGNDTIRLSYFYTPPPFFLFKAFIKAVYVTGNDVTHDRVYRLFISPEKQSLTIPIPPDFRERGIVLRDFSVKKTRIRNTLIGTNYDVAVEVEVEELLD